MRGQLACRSSAVLISPENFHGFTVAADADNSEIVFRVALNIFKIFSGARDKIQLTGKERCVKSDGEGALNIV